MSNSTSFGSSSGTGQSTGQSTSSSTPEVMNSANSEESLALSQAAEALGQQQYSWANQVYGQTQGVADEAINNYLAASSADMNLAQGAQSDFNNIYQPETQQAANEAGAYSSNARVGMNVGAAQATTAQGIQAGLNQTKQNLQSYGIDPSSGTYGELEASNNAAQGASEAGAGQQAQQATTATGRSLLAASIANTQQSSGMAVNATNAADTGYAGATNAQDAAVNTGVNAYNSADNYFNTASQIKLPPVGNTSTSQSTNQSTNKSASVNSSQSTPSQSSSSGGGGGGSSPTQAAYSNFNNPNDTGVSNGSGGGYSAGGAISPHPAATKPLPDATTGGHVPYEVSPSHGHITDDVHANLNAGEFVIPRDVTGYMGQKFFQDVIKKARAANMSDPAHGSKSGGNPNASASMGIPA